MQNKSITLSILLLIGILFLFPNLKAQQANTMYFMQGVPQRYQINPAFHSECDFFLGLPGLAPLQVQAKNSAFGLSDVLEYNSQIDSLISFLHPKAVKNSQESFLALLKDRNSFESDVSIGIASFGFKSKEYDTWFSFDISQRLQARGGYPRDLARLPLLGPDSAMSFDLNGLGIDLSSFTEFSMGISQKIGERLTVGIRGKLLFGQANLQTTRFDLKVETSKEIWPVHSDLIINASLPFAEFAYNPDGTIDLDNSDMKDDQELEDDLARLILNRGNFGLGLDIGAELKATEWLQLSASLVDIGYIKWKDNAINISNKADYDFIGIEVNLDDDDFLDTFLDSLDQTYINADAKEQSYHIWLPAKLYLGAAFSVHPKINFGILSKTLFYPQNIREQVTVSANFHPFKVLNASISYSMMNSKYNNIGFGLSLTPGPFNFYLITDTGPSVGLWPYEARDINLRIGMNLVFGCMKKQKTFDRPLIN